MSSHAPQALIVLMTLKCPLECQHCIVGSSPSRTEALPLAFILKVIDDAAALGIKQIGFTGGDPFVRQPDLAKCLSRVSDLRMKSVVITSAFWARSHSIAIATLERVSPISVLGLSTDTYHRAFTELDNIRHAIRAAKDIGIPQIEVQVVCQDMQDMEDLREQLGADCDEVRIRAQRLWPVGRAKNLLTTSTQLTLLEDLKLDCPMGAPIITEDKQMKGCCSALLDLGDRNPLTISNVNEEGGLLNAMESLRRHNHYQYLKSYGLRGIVDSIQSSPLSSRLSERYSDVCHLCHAIHADRELRHAVDQLFVSRPAREEIE